MARCQPCRKGLGFADSFVCSALQCAVTPKRQMLQDSVFRKIYFAVFDVSDTSAAALNPERAT